MTVALAVPLIRRRQLEEIGWHSRRVNRELESGYLTRVRSGVYIRSADVASLTVEDRIVVRARALALVATTRPVFCGITAAVLQGMPCLRDDGRLHVLTAAARAGAGPDIVRHRGLLEAQHYVDLDGLRCTPLAQTVVDVARGESRETAVSVADAALREQAFTPPGSYDVEEAERFREAALTWASRTTRGRRAAERILLFADGRAQRAGESISRLRLHDLGFAPPSLQVPVAGPNGTTYWVDFGLDDVDAWGEFDGRIKYRGLAGGAGRSPFEVMDAEKKREDWIRGTTQRRLVRWGWEDIRDAATLGRRLRAFGVDPPGR